MIPTRCTIKDDEYDCVNPPAYIVSIQSNEEEYMIAIVCLRHKITMEQLVSNINIENIKFEKLYYVGTNCVSR